MPTKAQAASLSIQVENDDNEKPDPEECAWQLTNTIPTTGTEKVCEVCKVTKDVYGKEGQQACPDCWGHILQLARADATIKDLARYVCLDGECSCEAKVTKLVSRDVLEGSTTKCGICWYSWYRNQAARNVNEGRGDIKTSASKVGMQRWVHKKT